MASQSQAVHDVRYSLDDDLSKPNGACLIKWSQNEKGKEEQQHTEIKEEKLVKNGCLYCWILPAKSINELSKRQRISFEMDYKIWIHHQNELYFSIFTASYAQIKKMHEIAMKTKIYFPSQGFNKVHEDLNNHSRSKELKDDMELVEKYMILEDKLQCKGHDHEATQSDYNYLAEILCKIFNSPSFAMQDWIYSALKDDKQNDLVKHDENKDGEQQFNHLNVKCMWNDLELLLKHKAYRQIKQWRHHLKYQFRSYEKEPFKSIHKAFNNTKAEDIVDDNDKLPKELFNTKYHSVFVVSTRNDTLRDQWAVKFEGKHYLLTIEWIDGFYVNFKIVPNNVIGHRVCWYSQCVSNDTSQELFSKRWSVLSKSYLPKSKFNGQVSFNYIANLVKTWMKIYCQTIKNCQHFARDIFAALDPAESKCLNTKFDQKSMFAVYQSISIDDAHKEGMNAYKCMDDVDVFNDDDDVDQFEVIVNGLGMTVYVDTEDEDINKLLSFPVTRHDCIDRGGDRKNNDDNNIKNNDRRDAQQQIEENKRTEKDETKENEQRLNHQQLTEQSDNKLWSEIDQMLDEELINTQQSDDFLPFINEPFVGDQKEVKEAQPMILKQRKKSKKKKSKRKKKATISNEGGQYEPIASHRARGNIRISRTLTEEIIPNKISGNINNVWNHMDRTTALQLNDKANDKQNNDENTDRKILNYDFYDKETGETLYCIIEKIGDSLVKLRENGGYKWKMLDKLFTAQDIENEYEISKDKLPESSRDNKQFKLQLEDGDKIKKELSNKESLEKFINNTPWHKIVVFKRKNNTRRITLSLNKQRFIKNCLEFVNNTSIDDGITLIPILMFNNDHYNHWIEHVWIISIDIDVDVGVSMRLNQDKIEVTGLHLDKEYIQIQHELVSFHYGCKCLNNFKTIINDLTVGNPDNQLNQLKHYKQKYEQFKAFLQELADSNDNHQKFTLQSMQKKAKQLVMPSGVSSNETKSKLTSSIQANDKNISNKKINSTLNASAAVFKYDSTQKLAITSAEEKHHDETAANIENGIFTSNAVINNTFTASTTTEQPIYSPTQYSLPTVYSNTTSNSLRPHQTITDQYAQTNTPQYSTVPTLNGNIYTPQQNNIQMQNQYIAPMQNSNTYYTAYDSGTYNNFNIQQTI